MTKLTINGCARACLALVAAGAASIAGATDEATPRSLKWGYSGEAFEEPANWAWATTSSESITAGPGAADTVRFLGLTTADATASKTVKLAADASVSNFIYKTARASGALTVDLNSKTLSVLGLMDLVTV